MLAADRTSAWTATFAVPLDPTLVGRQVASWSALFGTSGRPGMDISTGLIATVGY